MPAMRFRSVVLPEPEGPMSATNSPSGTSQVDAVEHRELLGVAPVDLRHLADVHHRHRGLPGAYPFDPDARAAVLERRRPAAATSVSPPARPSRTTTWPCRSVADARSRAPGRLPSRTSNTIGLPSRVATAARGHQHHRRRRGRRGSLLLLRLQERDLGAHLGLQVLVLVEDRDLHLHRGLGAVGGGDDLAQHRLVACGRGTPRPPPRPAGPRRAWPRSPRPRRPPPRGCRGRRGPRSRPRRSRCSRPAGWGRRSRPPRPSSSPRRR